MKHEKIFTRPDKSKVKVVVELRIDAFRQDFSWDFETSHCGPRKRTWSKPHSPDDYAWRRLGQAERKVFSQAKYMTLASLEEIQEVMLELWLTLKPDFGNTSGVNQTEDEK